MDQHGDKVAAGVIFCSFLVIFIENCRICPFFRGILIRHDAKHGTEAAAVANKAKIKAGEVAATVGKEGTKAAGLLQMRMLGGARRLRRQVSPRHTTHRCLWSLALLCSYCIACGYRQSVVCWW